VRTIFLISHFQPR